jgi:P4 family phage/plasmid primase-like protien
MAALGGATKLASPKAIVLLGTSAANGKSEMLAMLTGLLPKDAVCAVPPSRFSDERMLVQLFGRMLNACAELGTSRAVAAETFKAVITGDQIMAKDIYCPAMFFRPIAIHIYATNTLPPFHGGIDPGVERRLLVLQFNRTIPEDQRIREIGSRIATEEANALLAFAVEGASRALRTGGFTHPASSRQALREWVYQADPVLAWKERRTTYSATAQTPVNVAYTDFLNWADVEGVDKAKQPAVNNFVNSLRRHEGRLAKGTYNKMRMIRGLQLSLDEDA